MVLVILLIVPTELTENTEAYGLKLFPDFVIVSPKNLRQRV